jgi:phosphoglycolate phosphatase
MKTIIFDFDGVIVDSFTTAFNCLRSLHEKYQLPTLTKEKLEELFDGNLWENHARLGLEATQEKNLKEDLKKLLGNAQAGMPFFAGMSKILTQLSKQYTLVILSSNHAATIKLLLEREGVTHTISDVSGTETPGSKREKIQQLTQGSDGNTFFVTDTRGDILEAHGLPIHIVAVTWGYHSQERLAQAQPDMVVHSPEELLEYLQSFL